MKQKYTYAKGGRKTSVCTLKLWPATKSKPNGSITINKMPVKKYWPGAINVTNYLLPLTLFKATKKFIIQARVSGSGKTAQLRAFTHALSRALVKLDEKKYRPVLKQAGLLTRDSRMRERRKPGLAQSARAKKQSPKR